MKEKKKLNVFEMKMIINCQKKPKYISLKELGINYPYNKI